MQKFDQITTLLHGQALSIAAEAKVKLDQPQTAQTGIKISYGNGTYRFATNGPITYPVLLGSEAKEFPTAQIHAELKTIEELFLRYYGPKREPGQIVGDVFLAYRQLGPQLKILPFKNKQDVTNGNS